MTQLTPRPSVLIVDDLPNNVRLLSIMLTEKGYQVRKAINGQMALNTVRSLIPDLILLDINMPDLNGYQVCEQLKADEKTREIPVIFISYNPYYYPLSVEPVSVYYWLFAGILLKLPEISDKLPDEGRFLEKK